MLTLIAYTNEALEGWQWKGENCAVTYALARAGGATSVRILQCIRGRVCFFCFHRKYGPLFFFARALRIVSLQHQSEPKQITNVIKCVNDVSFLPPEDPLKL